MQASALAAEHRQDIVVKTYNLFISHAWSYGNAYDRLSRLLALAPRFSYRDYSVPRDDPVHNARNEQALYAAIEGRMVFCQVVIIMAGKYATYSKWIGNEILIATRDFDKPVLAVRPWGNLQVSSVVKDKADMLVGWNTGSIVSAIRTLAS